MRIPTRRRVAGALITVLALGVLQARQLPYQSRMADLGDIELQYMDFGGEGLPLIWVQDFHNYFAGEYEDSTFLPFFTELAREFRVLAPLRRGYGESTFTKWGYDVPRQAEDLLQFMDALGIERALLFGRLPANQEMTWIAEHHPERLTGLIYWQGNPILVAACAEPEVLAFIEHRFALAPDFEPEQEIRVVMSRAFWRPHFLPDADARIDVPALRFVGPEPDGYIPLNALNQLASMAPEDLEDSPGREAHTAYLRELIRDRARVSALREQLTRCDQTEAIEEGMQRAFGDRLQTVVEDPALFAAGVATGDFSAYLAWLLRHVRAFASELEDAGDGLSGSKPEGAGAR